MRLAPTQPAAGKFVEYDQYIDAQLHKTRWHVRSVDVATGLVTQLGAALAFFLVVSLVDHWLVPGGLGFGGRLAALAALALGEGWYFARRVWPPLVRHVNPAYAAETIERARPTLKNSLINFLFLRGQRQGVAPAVLEAIEEQAATRLSKTSVDGAVDTTHLLRMGYVLAAAAIALALYKVASPKDPLTTVGRVLLPWADIQAPSRVTIRDVQPGDTEAARGQQLAVSAEIAGLAEGDEVLLFYSTDDGQAADRPLPMGRPAGDYRYSCQLPPDGGGVQQGARYRIAAGDARTRSFRLSVVAAPTIVVERIDYEYPAYTGLLAHSVQRQGDIKALEGTRVTLHALANGEVQSASVDLECDGRPDVTLSPQETGAVGSFALSLKEPRPTSYQLLFTNAEGRQNVQPARYTIDVVPDLAPEIDFVGAPPDDVEMPADGTLELEIRAEDPDFALARVSLRAERGDRPLLERVLLGKAQRGQFLQRVAVPLAELKLQAGETLEYWAQADDNKRPQANRAETSRRKVRIVAPQQDPAKQPGAANDNKQPREGNDQVDQNRDRQPGQGDAGDRGPNDEPPDAADSPAGKGQRGGQQDQREPGEQNDPNDAGEQQRDEGNDPQGDGGGQQPDSRPGGKNQDGAAEDSSAGDQRQPSGGDNPPGEKNPEGGEPQSAGENRQGDKQAGEPQGGEQPGAGGDQAQGSGNSADNRQPGGESERGGKPGPGEGQEAEQPVSSDGSDDGTAIERILDHRKANPPAAGEQPDKRGAGDQPGGASDRGGKPNDGADNSAAGEKQGEPTPADPTNVDDADRAPRRRPDRDPAGASNRAEQPKDDQRGQGEKQQSPAGQPGDNQGQEGSGSPGSDGQGSPAPQEDNRPRDVAPRAQPKGDQPAKDAAKSPSNSKHQSNSDGGAEGDRSGGGKAGGGQKSNQPGEGEAGQNTPADQGGGAADQPGDGETGQRGGDGRQAAGSTGQPGERAGQGTRERRGGGERSGSKRPEGPRENQGGEAADGAQDGPSGQQPNDAPREPQSKQRRDESGDQRPANRSQPPAGQADKDQAAADRQPNSNGGESGSEGDGQPQSVPSGGQPHDAPDPNRRAPDVNEGADAPNLEYARQATDLALEHLKDQLSKDEPDPALLARLGWTREDLEKFVRRWETLRRDAQGASPDARGARRELDQSLRSLGLKPRDTTLSGNARRDDQSRGLKESRRTQPPAEYLERFKAYTQGTAKGSAERGTGNSERGTGSGK